MTAEKRNPRSNLAFMQSGVHLPVGGSLRALNGRGYVGTATKSHLVAAFGKPRPLRRGRIHAGQSKIPMPPSTAEATAQHYSGSAATVRMDADDRSADRLTAQEFEPSHSRGCSISDWPPVKSSSGEVPHSRTFPSRSAFAMTDTDESDIAAPAMIGLSNKPKNG